MQIIKQQIYLACEGVAYRVSDLQTKTRVKDQTAQHWIDCALEQSSELIWKRVYEPATQDPHLRGKLKPDEQKQIPGTYSTGSYHALFHGPPPKT